MSLTLTLSNIGTVKNANVNIRGLTAIAGYNGTGKSTIGKVLFSCIGGVKSLLNRESGIVSENLDRYVWFVDSSIRILSNILDTISKNEDINLLPFKDTSYIKAYINSEDNSLVVDGKLIMPYSFYCSFKSQRHIYNEMVTQIKKAVPNLDMRRIRKPLKDIAGALEQIALIKNRFSTTGMLERIGQSFNNEFFGSIVSHGHKTGYVILKDSEEQLLNVSFHNVDGNTVPEQIQSTKSYNDLINSVEGTFIDNTLYIDDYNLLSKGALFDDFKIKGLRREYYYRDSSTPIQLHKWDLLRKLNYSLKLNNFSTPDNIELTNSIIKINKGSFKPDGAGGVNFYDTDNHKILPINVACGNKLLGMLQLLMQSNAINKNSYIIIDEPENNLHPAKQVELAKTFVQMAKSDYKLLITTHSPYMLQALKTYSEYESILKDKTSFYFSKIDEETGYYNIESVIDSNGNLDDSEIFKNLYSPIEELMEIDNDIANKLEKEFIEKLD